MKKILSFMSAIGLTLPAVLTVVACGPKQEYDVVLLLSRPTPKGPTNIVTNAYRQFVDEFNQSEEMKNSSTKVKVVWEDNNPIMNYAKSGQPFPDLYLTYPDDVSNYVLNPSIGPSVRNMEQSITGKEEHDVEFENLFWSKNFLNEGMINDKLYVLPINKSFDVSYLNLKVFLELVSFVDNDLAKSLGHKLDVVPTKLFIHNNPTLVVSEADKNNLDSIADLKAKLQEIDDVTKDQPTTEILGLTKKAIANFFEYNKNVLDLVNIYQQLFKTNRDKQSIEDNYLGPNGNPDLMYALGLETPDNHIFTEYASAMKTHNIDVQSEQAVKFLYNIKNLNPGQGTMDLYLDNDKKSVAAQNLITYFDTLRRWAPKTGSSAAERWSGVINHGRVDNENGVAGHYFVQGTMLINSGTSAGSYDYLPDTSVGVKAPQFNTKKDLMIIPNSTTDGGAYFYQQGAGLSGFKSTGSNWASKEEVVTKFLNYLLVPKNQNRLAIMAGYVPPTTKALEMYLQYKDGSYDNQKKEWTIPKAERPANETEFEPIITIRATERKYIDQRDSLITGFLETYVFGKTETNIFTMEPNPLGSVVHRAINNSVRSFIFLQAYSFDSFYQNNKNKYTLIEQIRSLLPDTYNPTNNRIYFR